MSSSARSLVLLAIVTVTWPLAATAALVSTEGSDDIDEFERFLSWSLDRTNDESFATGADASWRISVDSTKGAGLENLRIEARHVKSNEKAFGRDIISPNPEALSVALPSIARGGNTFTHFGGFQVAGHPFPLPVFGPPAPIPIPSHADYFEWEIQVPPNTIPAEASVRVKGGHSRSDWADPQAVWNWNWTAPRDGMLNLTAAGIPGVVGKAVTKLAVRTPAGAESEIEADPTTGRFKVMKGNHYSSKLEEPGMVQFRSRFSGSPVAQTTAAFLQTRPDGSFSAVPLSTGSILFEGFDVFRFPMLSSELDSTPLFIAINLGEWLAVQDSVAVLPSYSFVDGRSSELPGVYVGLSEILFLPTLGFYSLAPYGEAAFPIGEFHGRAVAPVEEPSGGSLLAFSVLALGLSARLGRRRGRALRRAAGIAFSRFVARRVRGPTVHPSCVAARVTALACALAALSAVHAQDDVALSTPVVTPNKYTSVGKITGTELGKLIQTSLGDDNYEQVTVLVNSCSSGAGLDNVAKGLKGTSNVITTCKAGQTTQLTARTGFLPSFMDAVIADPKRSVDSAFDEGKKGDPRSPNNASEEDALRRRYEAMRKRALADSRNNPKDWPVYDKGGRALVAADPQKLSSNGAVSKKPIAAGSKSNHAVIYQPYTGRTVKGHIEKIKKALAAAGYDSIDVLTPLTKQDYDNLDKQAKMNQPLSVPADRATPANLENRLKALKAKFNDKEHLAVIVITHGGVVTRGNRGADAGPVGEVFDQLANIDHFGDGLTATFVAEEAVRAATGTLLTDFPAYSRWDSPGLFIQTAEASSPSGLPVSVTLNGLFLGELGLTDPLGFHHLPLSDAFIEALVGTTDVSSGFGIEFSFGGPDDFFRLMSASELAASGSGFGHYGMSLVSHIDGVALAGPASRGLVMVTALVMLLFAWPRSRLHPGNNDAGKSITEHACQPGVRKARTMRRIG